MRLQKIQNALRSKGIQFTYEEIGSLGRIAFIVSGRQYVVDEIRGNREKLPSGILTNIEGMGRIATQKMIADYILSMK